MSQPPIPASGSKREPVNVQKLRAFISTNAPWYASPEYRNGLAACLDEIENLRKDKARLDWLIHSGAHIAFSTDGDDCWMHHNYDPQDEERQPWNGPIFRDSRDAIDAALRGEPKEGM
jgi:hypothetical protein